MNVTAKDLETVGFVPYQYWGVINPLADPRAFKYGTVRSSDKFVHASVAEACKRLRGTQREHPVIYFNPTKEQYDAKWGAITFDLRTRHQLHQFATLLQYPLTVEQRTFLYDL